MKENMPDISFERSMNHNYMILSKCSFFEKGGTQSRDYRTRMLLENRIPGLLPITHRLVNGESRYYYEINSLQSLDRLYGKTEIRYDELRRLLTGCVALFDKLEEYLLDGTQVIMKPELIYMNVEKMDPYFVCYPDYEGDVRLAFMEFIDELLTRIDHTDEHAVMLGYQIYRYTRNPNYVISGIGNMIADMTYRKTDLENDRFCSTNNRQHNAEEIYADCANPGQTDIENNIGSRRCGTEFCCEDGQDEALEVTAEGRTNNIKDLAGGIFCIVITLCSGTIILGAHTIHTFRLSGNQELYLYGAMGMALVAAALFFSCYFKKRQQNKEAGMPDEDEGDELSYYTAAQNEQDCHKSCSSHSQNLWEKSESTRTDTYTADRLYDSVQNTGGVKQADCGETMHLDGGAERRMLYGNMNGREVHISLDRLPLTIGKLANVSDFVIDDAAVSKMHARFEEHDGRVYVCDLNSTNGTVCNGVLLGVNQSVVLEPGDKLRFGRTYLTYC